MDDRPGTRPWFATPLARSDSPDPRTRQEYEAQVEDYLTRFQNTVRTAVGGVLHEHQPTHLALVLVNDQDQPFTGVQVTAAILADGVRYPDDDQVVHQTPDLPDPPAPYGTPRRDPVIPGYAQNLYNAQQDLYYPLMLTKWDVVSTSDGLRITFDPIDLRARTRIPFETVSLFINPGVHGPLTVHWTAAGLDAHGATTGSVELAIAPSTLDFGAWLAGLGTDPS